MAKKTEPTALDERIVRACDAYGIDQAYLFASHIDPETAEVVLLTCGGKRVTWLETETVEPLTFIEVTGINPEAFARKAALKK